MAIEWGTIQQTNELRGRDGGGEFTAWAEVYVDDDGKLHAWGFRDYGYGEMVCDTIEADTIDEAKSAAETWLLNQQGAT